MASTKTLRRLLGFVFAPKETSLSKDTREKIIYEQWTV